MGEYIYGIGKAVRSETPKRKIQKCQLHDKQVTAAVRSWTLV
jgi:hypothetical protein